MTTPATQAKAPSDPDRSARDEPAEPSVVARLARGAAEGLLSPFAEIGMLFTMLGQAIFWGIRPPYRFRQFIAAMEFIGVGSIFIVSLTGFFVGAVLGLQLVDGFRTFGAETQTGAVVGIGLARELGPVFTALMVSSRAGSAMTTELGSMRVTSQIDAMTTMAVNPVQYLVVPRIFAGVAMVPFLTVLFNVIAMTGSYLVAVNLLGLDGGIYLDRFKWLVDWEDIRQGLIKAAVFGGTVSLIACRQGFFASGGASGVGLATNRCVVHCAVAILALDYFMTGLILGQGLF